MPVVVRMQRSDVKVLNLWNGSSNDVPPIDPGFNPTLDYRTLLYNDSAWASSAVPTIDADLLADRFTLNARAASATRVTPNLDVAAEPAWPTVTPSSSSAGMVLRWHFNPGPGPFTNAELLIRHAATSFGSPPSVAVYLNFDGDLQGIVAAYNQSTNTLTGTNGNPPPSDTWATTLIPNQINVLSVYIHGGTWITAAWLELAWRLLDAAELGTLTYEYLHIPITASIVKAQRVVQPTLSTATYPGWTDYTYDDSAWPTAVVADHPLSTDADLDTRWDALPLVGPTVPRGETIWPIATETTAQGVAIFRMHFTVPDGVLVPQAIITTDSGNVLGTIVNVLGSTSNSGGQWINGPNGSDGHGAAPGFFEPYLITGVDNVLAWVVPSESVGQTNGLGSGDGAWWITTITLAYEVFTALPPTAGRSFAQIIG